jgi:circadian clock protein KaiC
MYVLKARGTAHSNQVREFLLTDRGIELIPAYVGPSGVLTGSARVAQEARERAETIAQEQQRELSRRERAREKAKVEMQIAALRAQLEEDERDTARELDLEAGTEIRRDDDRAAMARSRRVTAPEKKL